MDILIPSPMPAYLWIKPTHLQCGACGFNGEVLEVYLEDDGEPTPVCNCPIEATLTV